MSGPKSSRYTITPEQLKRILEEQERLRRELEEKARKERECKEAKAYHKRDPHGTRNVINNYRKQCRIRKR